jgi:hypothetical protein
MVLSTRRLPSLLRGPGEPSSPALSGTTKALRLPIRASAVTYGFASAAHPIPPAFVFAAALPQGRRSLPGPGFGGAGRPTFRLSSCGHEWDLPGLQTILPVPLLRSSTPVEPTCPRHLGHIDAAHALRTAKASAIAISGLTHAASAPAVLRFAFRVATRAQGSLPAGWLAFAGRASNPLDRYKRFQLVLTFILLSCSPDASAISALRRPGELRRLMSKHARGHRPVGGLAFAPERRDALIAPYGPVNRVTHIARIPCARLCGLCGSIISG